jgi:phosphoglycerol transferase MdoB-like AlkP superfamily enzyme
MKNNSHSKGVKLLLAHALIAFLLLTGAVHAIYPHGLAFVMDMNLPTQVKVTYNHCFEVVSWFVIWLFFYILTRRMFFSIIATFMLLLVFLLGNMEKMRLLHSPLMVSDVSAVKELMHLKAMFSHYLLVLGLALGVVVLVGWLAWKKSRANAYLGEHQVVIALGFVLVLTLVLANRFAIGRFLKQRDLFFNKVNPVMSVFQYGGLATLVQAAVFVPDYKDISNYSKAAIARIIKKYGLDQSTAAPEPSSEPVNLIIVLTEAFTDPEEIGWQTTQDAIPAFHAARKKHGGRVLSPVLGGKSANAEFELLTGFSMRFTPANSIPYTDLIHRPIPSLARFLGKHDYLSMAIHVASLDFFNYKKVYELEGFTMFTTLWDKVPKADPMGLHASRQDLFQLIEKASTFHKPYFLFTFPNYTHGDWDYDAFADSELDILDPEQALAPEEKKRVKTYINALHYSDALFRDLIDHFSTSPDKTLIVMLGDHQPFLTGYRQKAWEKMVAKYGEGELAKVMTNYWVPVALWSNFQRPEENIELSMNFLPSYLIEQLGLEADGFYRFNQLLKDKIGVFSQVIKNSQGEYSFYVPPEYLEMARDYEMLQYDLLQGNNYFNQLITDGTDSTENN